MCNKVLLERKETIIITIEVIISKKYQYIRIEYDSMSVDDNKDREIWRIVAFQNVR